MKLGHPFLPGSVSGVPAVLCGLCQSHQPRARNSRKLEDSEEKTSHLLSLTSHQTPRRPPQLEFPGQGMPLGWSVKSEASSQIGNLCACPLPSAPVRWAWLRPPHPVYTGRHQLPSSCAHSLGGNPGGWSCISAVLGGTGLQRGPDRRPPLLCVLG